MKDISASLLLVSLFTFIRGEYQDSPEPIPVRTGEIPKEPSENQLSNYLLFMAFSFSALLTFLYLVKGFYFTNAKNKFKLHLAIREGNTEKQTFLLNHGANINEGDDVGNTPLHYAAAFPCDQNMALTRLLLKKGADITKMNYKRETPITQVDEKGRTPLHHAVYYENKEFITFLLDNGADIKAVNHEGNTPLHYAAAVQSKDIVEILLARGAHINPVNKGGATPLHCALYPLNRRHADINLDMIKLLVDGGAAINQGDKEGNTPLHHVIMDLDGCTDVISFLLDRGANIDQVNYKGETFITQADRQGNTPLHRAAEEEDVKLLTVLLNTGVKLNQKNHAGQTPFDLIPKYRSDIKDLFVERVLWHSWQLSVKKNLKHEQPDNKGYYYTDNHNFTFYHQWLPQELLEDTLALLPKVSKTN